jgi:hypothetical protein
MNKPNFIAMTKQELRAYVLEHRDDARGGLFKLNQ